MTFKELLEEIGVTPAPEGHHHQTQGWVQFDCPFCGRNSNHYHMGCNISHGYVNCWRCGSHSLATVIKEYSGWSYKKVKNLIEQLDIPTVETIRKKSPKTVNFPQGVGPLQQAHIRYLNARGFNHRRLERLWNIRGIGISSGLSWRIFIPIFENGRVVSWTTRSIGENKRYISAASDQEVVSHKDVLYGIDFVRHSAIIVEGPLDAWAVGPGAVATFGTGYTKKQVNTLIHIPRRIICYDNNRDAQKQARRLMNELGAFGGETVNVLLDAKDPAEANIREIKKLRNFLEK